MNEQDVRALVREAIERHLGRADSRFGATKVAPYGSETPDGGEMSRRARLQSSYGHASHLVLNILPGSGKGDGMCIIEPAVRCTHCGFCQSYGH